MANHSGTAGSTANSSASSMETTEADGAVNTQVQDLVQCSHDDQLALALANDTDDIRSPFLRSEDVQVPPPGFKLPRVGTVSLPPHDDGDGNRPAMLPTNLSWWDRRRFWANQSWFYEIFAAGISAFSVVAIFVLLSVYNDKPTPDWPQVITINSAIAVLTTLLKGSMVFAVSECLSQVKWGHYNSPACLNDMCVFDSASRGPWGASQLLLGRQKDPIAILGALVVILALAVDPFA
ncbi:Hypothetical protein D9617_9g025900 [Elsinoe fawcettii]|nr:Hypothetical protein D9617_9g025900 [Elsinoe fawcettii]